MPENSAYMIAAYAVAGVVYVAYAVRLVTRAVAALKPEGPPAGER